MKICDKVIKNPDTWIENDFLGRGVGIGIIVEPLFSMDDKIDVRWHNVICFESVDQVVKIEDNCLYYLINDEDSISFLIKEFGNSPYYSTYDQFLEINIKDKIWKSVSFVFPTPDYPNVVTKNIISLLLRKYKLLKIKLK